MDKLKPIIEQKFWIFLGLALILPFVGWYLAASSYAKGVQEREDLIEGTFGKMEFSPPVPNGVWIQGAQDIVQEEQQRLEVAQQELWNSQKESMKWPPFVQRRMEDVAYEGEIDPQAREDYSQSYFDQLKEMEQRLEPFNFETGEGLLLFDPASYTHVPYGTWDRLPPTSKEMWDAQIDTWLVQAVFDSIVSMNKGSGKITEAPIRKIIELTLRGGERDYTAATAGGEGAGDSGEGLYEEMDISGSEEFGGSERGFDTAVRFDLSEELGPITAAGGFGDEYSESFDGSADDAAGGYGDSGYSSESEESAAGNDRYVDDDEGYPFRTRAFVLGVVMDHTELPEFMAELSRSDWPIQIIRVQTRAINLEQLPPAMRRGGGSTYAERGGLGMSSGGYGPSGYGPGAYSDEGGGEGYTGGAIGTFGSGSIMSRESYSESDSNYGNSGTPGIPGGALGTGNAVGLAQQAMSDPYLAEVWIGGLITLFRPVEDAGGQNAQSPGQTPDTILPDSTAAAGSNAAQPAATAPGAELESATPSPADGTATSDAADDDASSAASPAGTGAEPTPQTTPPATDNSTSTDN